MQKTTVIIAMLLVTTSLSIGIVIGLTWQNQTPANNYHSSTPTNSPQTTSQPTLNTNTPTPNGDSTPKVAISYSELSTADMNGNTRVVLSVNVNLISGNLSTLEYSRFTLSVFVPRGGLLPAEIGMKYAEVQAKEMGSVTVDSNKPSSTFHMSFEFPTVGKNFDDIFRHFSYYELGYSSYYDHPITIEWTNQ